MNLHDQLTSVQNQMAEEKGKTADKNVELIAQLESKEAELLQAIMVEDQQQASQLRIQDATEQAAYFLDNLVIEGLTMRELCVDEPQYQMLRIAVQNKIINLAEDNSRQISELQAEETAQQNALKKRIDEFQAKADQESREALEDHETIKQLRIDLKQAQSEVADYQGKLKNATDEIERLNSHVDDLRKEIAVGARNAYKVTDVEQTQQLKQLADQIKASRVHVYDVVPDSEINPKNYTAKRADTGVEVTYNWTQSKNYIEIKDAAEVERFRQQFANKEAVSDSTLGHEETPNVTPPTALEEAIQAIPSAIPPQVSAVPAPVVEGQQSVEVPGETVEERLAALEAHVFGYVKGAVA